MFELLKLVDSLSDEANELEFLVLWDVGLGLGEEGGCTACVWFVDVIGDRKSSTAGDILYKKCRRQRLDGVIRVFRVKSFNSLFALR